MSGRGALSGVRVIEVTGEAVQLCGKVLADFGAEVIVIEPPAGASARSIGPFYGDAPGLDSSLYFWHYNTNKRSVTLELDNPDGQALFHRLATTADVVLEGEAPGVMARRGLDYARLAVNNKALVYCSATPFGQDGPWRDHKASDLTLLAAGGQMALCGYDDTADDPALQPIAPGGGNGWHIGANYAAIAILVALHARDATGLGQYIDLSVQEAIALCTEGAFAEFLTTGKNRERRTGRHAAFEKTPRVQFRCRDGRYVNTMLPIMPPERFMRLLTWFVEEDVAGELTDDRFLDPDVLSKEMGKLREAVARLCVKLTADEVFHRAQALRFAWTIVRAPSEVLDDVHQADRGFFVQVEHPELARRFTYPGAPYIMYATPWRIRRRAPLLGEDTVALLHGEIGVPLSRLTVLREAGAI